VHPGAVTLTNGRSVESVRVESADGLPDALMALGLAPPRPTVVLVGGAGELSKGDLVLLRPIFSDVLLPAVEQLGACVVDGGTAAGVMQLLGEARAEAGADFPLLGVAAVGTVAIPGADLTERPSSRATTRISSSFPGRVGVTRRRDSPAPPAPCPGAHQSVTVLLDGGEIAWRDVEESVRAGRRVLVVAGNGRTANVLGAALPGEAADERARRLAASRLLTAVDPASLAASL
jgi:SLOG in TRPM, prokaryote